MEALRKKQEDTEKQKRIEKQRKEELRKKQEEERIVKQTIADKLLAIVAAARYTGIAKTEIIEASTDFVDPKNFSRSFNLLWQNGLVVQQGDVFVTADFINPGPIEETPAHFSKTAKKEVEAYKNRIYKQFQYAFEDAVRKEYQDKVEKALKGFRHKVDVADRIISRKEDKEFYFTQRQLKNLLILVNGGTLSQDRLDDLARRINEIKIFLTNPDAELREERLKAYDEMLKKKGFM